MTQAEKLKALLEKAIASGLEKAGHLSAVGWMICIRDYPDGVDFNALIFNHDFAKALFGEYRYGKSLEGILNCIQRVMYAPAWQIHLQRAVIDKDPIDYMYKAVFGDE